MSLWQRVFLRDGLTVTEQRRLFWQRVWRIVFRREGWSQ